MGEEEAQCPHIAILCSPGMGHLIPIAEFARQLVHHHHFSVTLITPPTDSSPKQQQAVLDALPSQVHLLSYPNLPFHNDPKLEFRLSFSISHNLPYLHALLKDLASTAPLIALVVDIFGLDAFDIATELGISPYVFFTSPCMSLSFGFYFHAIDAATVGEFKDLTEPVRWPGCVPVHGKDLLDPVQDRGCELCAWFQSMMNRLREARGILVNSFEELEPGAVMGMREGPGNIPKVYPVGPLVWTGGSGGFDCKKWLDEQPRGSLLYVSFGSGGTLSSEQMNELARGLEMSGHRFLWVVKSPHEHEASATFFSVESRENPFGYLPDGFLDRTKGLGLVVPSWVPQTQVLSHGSTGGFLTHCGWNSTLESIVYGVPLIAWPLYAEQKMNAVMLVEDVKVALRPKASEDGMVGREEISRVIKCLMEGEEGKKMRSRMEELSAAATRAVGEGGSSFMAFSEVAREWKDLMEKQT